MQENLETKIKNPVTATEKEIASLGMWFHNLHLPDGIMTAPEHPLGDFPAVKWNEIKPYIPEDLTGLSVLDIGCNAGFYCFEMAKRGANVLGIDSDMHYLKQAEWAKKFFRLKGPVEFRQMQIYDLWKLDRKFDIVIFMGLFYHLKYPLIALHLTATKFRKMLLFQTMTMPDDKLIDIPENVGIFEREMLTQSGWPKMSFVENSVAGDNTNWWVPNKAAVEALLRSSGLKIDVNPGEEVYICSHNSLQANTEDELENSLGILKYTGIAKE